MYPLKSVIKNCIDQYSCLSFIFIHMYKTLSAPQTKTDFCKKCRSWWDGSSGSILLAIPLQFLSETPIRNNISDQVQSWKSPLQKVRDERVKVLLRCSGPKIRITIFLVAFFHCIRTSTIMVPPYLPKVLRQGVWINDVDTNRIPQNVAAVLQNMASDQGVHCLPLIHQWLDTATGLMNLTKSWYKYSKEFRCPII